MRAVINTGRKWCRAHNTYAQRIRHSPFYNLLREARENDVPLFFNYTRLTPQLFDELCNMIEPLLPLGHTNYRETISHGI